MSRRALITGQFPPVTESDEAHANISLSGLHTAV